MGAQRAIADVAEPQTSVADHGRSEPLCQLVTEDGDGRLAVDPAIELSEEAIRQRSEQIWEREGRPEGYAEDHWRRARAELAELMAKTSNAQLAIRPMDDVAPSIPACTLVPEAPPSAAAPDSQPEVLDGDLQALSGQEVAFSPARDESVVAISRPLRLPLTPRPQQTALVPSIICAGLVLRGSLESSGDVQFDGILEGDIFCASLAVGEAGVIQGEVVADEVTVRGRIEGRICARRVYLFSSACVEGDIHYGTLAVEFGAHLTAISGSKMIPW